MKRQQNVRLQLVLLLIVFLCAAAPMYGLAATKKYKSCAAVQKVYKGGIAKSGAKDKRSKGKAQYKPFVNTALYKANKGLDRDKDGIVCER